MSHARCPVRLALLGLLFALGGQQLAWGQPIQQNSSSSTQRRAPWLERPWGLRYVFFVTDSWSVVKEVAKTWPLQPDVSPLDRLWPEVFDPSLFFPSKNEHASPDEGLAVVVIDFDGSGVVTTPHTFRKPLHGKLDRLMHMALAEGDAQSQPRFRLGEWFLGLGDISADWAPALCMAKDMPSPFSSTDTGYLYGPKFEMHEYRRTFGCREWAYQLNDPGRPYIDITSYIPKRFDRKGPGTYIRDTTGWAGFDDRKPVIGRHETQWYCLHDCPDGAAPGPIADIKAWARKNGWPAPKPPTRIPVFPDPPALSGDYPR